VSIFASFVQTLSVFSPKASSDEKLKMAFRCYDVDCDGFVSETDLSHVLKLMVGSNVEDSQLSLIAKKTIAEADKDGDGRISVAEFSVVIASDSESLLFKIA